MAHPGPPFQPMPFGPSGGPTEDWDPHAQMPYPDEHHRGSPPPLNLRKEPKIKKASKVIVGPVETIYEGYTLEQVPSPAGGLSWARAGFRPLPFDSAKLLAITKQHQQRTGFGPTALYSKLDSDQQGVITDLISRRRQRDDSPNAEWVLRDVQRRGEHARPNRSAIVKQLQVIIKRQEKKVPSPADRAHRGPNVAYLDEDIIDLTEPAATKQAGKVKKGGKARRGEAPVLSDDWAGPGYPDFPPPFPAQHFPQQVPREEYPAGPFPPHVPAEGHAHPQQPPPNEMPWAHDFPGQPPPAPPFGRTDVPMDHPPPRGPPGPPYIPAQPPAENPFMPNPPFNRAPGPFDEPLPHDRGRDDLRRPGARGNTQSPSRHRRRSSSARRTKELEGKFHDLKEEVRRKMDHWHLSSASSSEGDGVFSPGPSDGSFTPPSTPPRSLVGPKGGLRRRKSVDRRPRRQTPARDRSFGDERVERVELRPARPARAPRNSPRYSPVEPRYAPERVIYEQERPRLSRTQRPVPFDDFDDDDDDECPPSGRAESRYAPPPQRRLTNYEEGYAQADFRDQYQRPRRETRRPRLDHEHSPYEARRREDLRDERHRERVSGRVVGGGGGGFYHV